MKPRHDGAKKRPARVAEPVQVYLDAPDQERLRRLAARLGVTKSDVLRQGLAALDAQTRRSARTGQAATPLPTFAGQGLQPGVDLDDGALLLELMDGRDAPG